MTNTPAAPRTSAGLAAFIAAACTVALAMLIVGLAGVGRAPAPDVEPAAAAPAPPVVTAPVGPTSSEQLYLEIVNDTAPSAQSAMTQQDLIRVGHTVCDLEADPSNPLTRPQMVNAITGNGVSGFDASVIVVAAEKALC
jgi:hypothetical protein